MIEDIIWGTCTPGCQVYPVDLYTRRQQKSVEFRKQLRSKCSLVELVRVHFINSKSFVLPFILLF